MRNFLITILTTFVFLQSGWNQSAIDSNTVIYGWKLDNQNIFPEKADIDTNLEHFQQHNVVFRKYHSVSTIGSNASPYLSNDYFRRKTQDNLLFLNSYIDYFNTVENTIYVNTRKPFTHLSYLQSWPRSNREEHLKITHAQNINSRLNIGFDVDIIADKAQYRYQNTNQKGFKVFSSYNSDNYDLHTSFNLNRYLSGESGGIIDSLYRFSDWQFPKDLETYFTGSTASGNNQFPSNVKNSIRYIDGMISQSLKLFTIGDNSDDSISVSSSMAQPILSHVIYARRVSKIYRNDDSTNNEYYQNVYSNNKEVYDSTAELRVTNSLQLDFKTKIRRKVIAGIYGNINHEYQKYTYYSLFDTTLTNPDLIEIDQNKSLNNVFTSAGIYGKFWTHFQSRFSGTIYLVGYKAGQTRLDGLINTNVKILNRPYELYVNGAFENIIPSYQLTRYYSNHYIWENDLNSISKLYLSSKIAAPSNRFEIEGHYTLLSNHIYLTDSMPVAHESPLSVSALSVQKEFVVWKLHSFNRVTFQVSENRNIIEIPSLIFFNSTYIDQTWFFRMTDGRLRTMLGIDIYYSSEFNGYTYNPALAQFYQGESFKIGNYPFIDLWVNVRIKRTRLFLKYEHINSSRDNLDYYLAVNHPAKQRALKFGLSWTFYD